jgi:hypothetical protein
VQGRTEKSGNENVVETGPVQGRKEKSGNENVVETGPVQGRKEKSGNENVAETGPVQGQRGKSGKENIVETEPVQGQKGKSGKENVVETEPVQGQRGESGKENVETESVQGQRGKGEEDRKSKKRKVSEISGADLADAGVAASEGKGSNQEEKGRLAKKIKLDGAVRRPNRRQQMENVKREREIMLRVRGGNLESRKREIILRLEKLMKKRKNGGRPR